MYNPLFLIFQAASQLAQILPSMLHCVQVGALSAIQLFQVSRPTAGQTPAPPSWTAVDNISPGSAKSSQNL